ncbi:MAG: aminotransferase class I/II-fold pyridoxal phosphate-dependent enzyme, partial [Sphingorhabdus sp.]
MSDPTRVFVNQDTTLRQAMAAIDVGSIGIALLIDSEDKLKRTVTDGDLRRHLLSGGSLDDQLRVLPQTEPVVIAGDYSRRTALAIMKDNGINCLPVIDDTQKVIELLHRADLDDQILLSTPHIGEAEIEYVEQAFSTNWIAPLGPNVDAFERELADLVDINHAAALSSGTAAIHLALILLGIKQGDKVFCSTLTFAASANPIAYQNAEPVFIDADEDSWGMCPISLVRAFEAASTEGWMPKAVIVVNLYGQSSDMDPLLEICERYGVPIVEDAAESLGATYKGKASGTFGVMGIYSFNGNKIITTSGGGMLISDRRDLIDRARFLATQAREPAAHYEHKEIGYNYRMSNILAGVGRGQLKVLEKRVAARRAVFDAYQTALASYDCITWMPEPEWSVGTRWLTAGTVSHDRISRTDLIAKLADELIEARPVWKPMHLQPVFKECRLYSRHNAPTADRLFNEGICLPSGSNMAPGQLERITSVIA